MKACFFVGSAKSNLCRHYKRHVPVYLGDRCDYWDSFAAAGSVAENRPSSLTQLNPRRQQRDRSTARFCTQGPGVYQGGSK